MLTQDLSLTATDDRGLTQLTPESVEVSLTPATFPIACRLVVATSPFIPCQICGWHPEQLAPPALSPSPAENPAEWGWHPIQRVPALWVWSPPELSLR